MVVSSIHKSSAWNQWHYLRFLWCLWHGLYCLVFVFPCLSLSCTYLLPFLYWKGRYYHEWGEWSEVTNSIYCLMQKKIYLIKKFLFVYNARGSHWVASYPTLPKWWWFIIIILRQGLLSLELVLLAGLPGQQAPGTLLCLLRVPSPGLADDWHIPQL